MSNGRDKPKAGIKLEDVCFYFDAVARDRLDAAGLSRKSGEVLALRERLLRLPATEFDAIIKTLRQLIEEKPVQAAPSGQDRQRAQTLYDSARVSSSVGSAATTKVSPA